MDVPSGRVVGGALGGEGGAPLPSSKALPVQHPCPKNKNEAQALCWLRRCRGGWSQSHLFGGGGGADSSCMVRGAVQGAGFCVSRGAGRGSVWGALCGVAWRGAGGAWGGAAVPVAAVLALGTAWDAAGGGGVKLGCGCCWVCRAAKGCGSGAGCGASKGFPAVLLGCCWGCYLRFWGRGWGGVCGGGAGWPARPAV